MSRTILLVNPPIYDFAAYDLFSKPLGLLYLASRLRQAGYEAVLVDALDRNHAALAGREWPQKHRANGTGKYYSEIIEKPACLKHVPRHYRRYGLPEEQFGAELERAGREFKPLAVLVGSMMTYWYPAVADAIRRIRRSIPDTPIGLGGVYASLMPEHAQRVCRPDRVFTGCGMGTVLEWLTALGAGPQLEYQETDFEGWPVPAYDLYERLDYLTVLTSVGCPFHCDYCASRILQPRFGALAPETFLAQLRELIPLLKGQKEYHIAPMDDALLVNPESHIVPILRGIAQWNLPVRFYTPNGLHARFITAEVAQLMFETNFRMIRLSYESAGGGLGQKASDGKIGDADFCRAVENLMAAGYEAGQIEAYVLAGLPGQSMEEIERSAAAVHRAGLKVRFSQFTPIPGTPLFGEACRSYGVDPAEPLLHNNSILPALDWRVGYETFQRFKDETHRRNQRLAGEPCRDKI